MHCSSCASLSSINDIILNEEEIEQLRLRKLMQDKILKIEKENLETVQKELQEDFKKTKVQGELKSKHTVKSLINRKVNPIHFKESALKHTPSSTANKRIENTDEQKCCSGNLNSKHSKIHFLNHFQSSLEASKAQLQFQRLEAKPKHLPSVSYCQNDLRPIPITVEKLQPSVRKTAKFSNTAIHHITSANTKNLTVQVLPSISILGTKSKSSTNVSLEEISEEIIATRGDVAGTSFSGQSSNREIYFDSRPHSSEAFSTGESGQQGHSKRSVFTMTNSQLQNEASASNKNQLKSLVKEILSDLHISPTPNQQFDFKKKSMSLEKVSKEVSHCKEPENKMHPSCCHCNKHTETVSTQTSMKSTSYTQTEDLKPKTNETTDLRYIIREVISEYENVFKSMVDTRSTLLQLEKSNELHKSDKEVQTICSVEMKAINACESKEIQTSFVEENLCKDQEMKPKLEESDHTVSNMEQTPESSEIIKQMSQVASKIDNVMNTLNEHVCKANDNHVKNLSRNISSPSNMTREVSLQFGPQVTARGTNTILKKNADAGNQCNLSAIKSNLSLVNASTETLDEHFQLPEILEPTTNTDAFTQCENCSTAVIDSCTQTKNFTTSLQSSDHSNTTSTTSTPVNDTLFVDDSFSEGELPWHLRFLSCHYKNKGNHLTCDNLDGSSTPSEERDYSLSEGEIPPRYVQHYNMHPLAEHSKKGEPIEFNSEAVQSLPIPQNTSNPHTQMKTHPESSVTSLFENKMRCSSTHLPSSQIQYYSSKSSTFTLPKNRIDYKHVSFQNPVHSHITSSPVSDKSLKSCHHSSKLNNARSHCNFSAVHSCKKTFSSTSSEESINVHSMNQKPTFKPFCEKHCKSQSPVNWSSLSSLELSNGDIQEETKEQGKTY